MAGKLVGRDRENASRLLYVTLEGVDRSRIDSGSFMLQRADGRESVYKDHWMTELACSGGTLFL